MKNSKTSNKNIFSLLLFALIIVGVSIMDSSLFLKETYKVSISCERSNYILENCKISRFNWRKKETKIVPIEIIKQAETKTDTARTLLNGGSVVKKLVLKTWTNEIYIADNQFSFNQGKISHLANEINDFLKNKKQKKIEFEYSIFWEISLFTIMSIALIVWFIMVAIHFFWFSKLDI